MARVVNIASVFGAGAKTFVLSTFTQLSFWKRWLVRLAVMGVVVGGALWVKALFEKESANAWSNAGLRSGGGFLLGFAAGAFVRLFLKLGILLAIVTAGGAWAMSQWGWIDLPYESLADVQAAFSVKAQASASWLEALFKSHLPHSAATGVGLFSGVTQRPRMMVAKKE